MFPFKSIFVSLPTLLLVFVFNVLKAKIVLLEDDSNLSCYSLIYEI